MHPHLRTFIFGILTAALVVVIGIKSCDKPIYVPTKEVVKAHVQEAKIKTELAKAIVLHDTILKWRIKYKKIRYDSLIPCEIKLITCDTIILKDSTLIAAQDSIIDHYSALVSDWKHIHSSDSTSIIGLNKEVKKQKRLKVLYGVGSLLGGYLIFRLK
jgi:hypothetical protein